MVYDSQVAVTGISFRGAGADDPAGFWRLLQSGGSGRRVLSDRDLKRRGVRREVDSDYVPVIYPLRRPASFDFEAFGITRTEAEFTDPQHRIIIEACYRAVENSGHDITRLSDVVGVYMGAKTGIHGQLLRDGLGKEWNSLTETRVAIGNEKDYLASKISYRYGLTGPSVSVQTACSTSLVALHIASQAILNGECDSALVGGVAVDLQDAGYHFTPGDIYSPRGLCEPFMTSADGIVEGNGVAVVFLRRLDLALADGDPLHALIVGSAVNNDGADRAGFSVPGVGGQAAVIEEALDVAGLTPGRIGLFEAHGTGTKLGDLLEVEAATRAFGANGRCRLHSVKANIGHLSAAAGTASVISSILALRNEKIPPNMPLRRGSTPIDLSHTLFALSDRVEPWDRGSDRRFASVSSFGLGGTNAHVILGDADERAISGRRRQWQLLPLSASSQTTLRESTRVVNEELRGSTPETRHDIAHTARLGRPELPARTFTVLGADKKLPDAEWFSTKAAAGEPPLVFLLPDQDGQRPGVTRALYERERVFRKRVDAGIEAMKGHLTPGRLDLVRTAITGAAEIVPADVAQPLIHLIGVGVAALLEELGVVPAAVAGHGVGEVTGAYLSGVLSFEDAARVVCWRANSMAEAPQRRAYLVDTSVDNLAFLPDDATIAEVNGTRSVVVSTSPHAEKSLIAEFDRRGIIYRQHATSYAFRHPNAEIAATRFAIQLARVPLQTPNVRLISCRSGRWLKSSEATDPHYWSTQIVERGEFARSVATLRSLQGAVYLHIGSGQTLLRTVQMCGVPVSDCVAVLSGETADSQRSFLHALGELWTRGVRIDWEAYSADDRGLRTGQPIRIFTKVPVLHCAIRDRVPGIDPVELEDLVSQVGESLSETIEPALSNEVGMNGDMAVPNIAPEE